MGPLPVTRRNGPAEVARGHCRPARAGIRRWLLVLGLSVLGLSVLGLNGCAGGGPSLNAPGEPQLPLDAYVSTRVDTTGRLAPLVRVEAPYRSLVFQRDGEQYVADLRVQVTAWRDGGQVGGGVTASRARAGSYQATRANGVLVVEVPLLVRGEGPVKLGVEAVVPRTARRWLRRLEFSPRAVGLMPVTILGVEVLPPADGAGEHVVTTADDTVTLAVRLRRIGSGAWPAGGVRVTTSLAGGGREQPQLLGLPLAPGWAGADTTLRQSWPAESLPFGRTTVDLALEAREEAQVERLPFGPTVALLVLRVPFADDRPWRLHVGWLDGLLPGTVADSLRALPAVARAPAWAGVWQRIAAAAGEPPALAETAHLRRVAEADDRFGQFGRGALSDRGRAYIRYGEAERVEQTLDDLAGAGVWEVWHYPSRGLRLVFYDANAINDFRLVEVRQD
jgi:GWxTD domain-containing protein